MASSQTLEDRQRWCRAALQTQPSPSQQQHQLHTPSRHDAEDPELSGSAGGSVGGGLPPLVRSPSASADPYDRMMRNELKVHQKNEELLRSMSPSLLVVDNRFSENAVSSLPGASTHFISDAKKFTPHIGGATTRAEQLRRMKKSAPTVVARHLQQQLSPGTAFASPSPNMRDRADRSHPRGVSPEGALFMSPLRVAGASTPTPGAVPSQQKRSTAAAATAAASDVHPRSHSRNSNSNNSKRGAAATPTPAAPVSSPENDGKPLPHFMRPLVASQQMHAQRQDFLLHRQLETTPFSTASFGQCRGHKVHPTAQQLEWSRPFQRHAHSTAVERICRTADEKRVRMLQQAHEMLKEEMEAEEKRRQEQPLFAVLPTVTEESLQQQQRLQE